MSAEAKGAFISWRVEEERHKGSLITPLPKKLIT
jgi:hypothetical protein